MNLNLNLNLNSSSNKYGQKPHAVVEMIPDEVLDRMTGHRREQVLAARAQVMEDMELDPYNYGYEDAAWDEIDWMIARLRVANPGVVIEPLVMGANGGGKTFYAAKRFTQVVVSNPKWLVWQFSADEKNSRRIPQKTVYEMLPTAYRNETGKLKRTVTTKLNYTAAGGFTDNTFSLPSSTVVEFRFYSADIGTLEGPRPHFVWSDEELPLEWLEGATSRLHTHAEATKHDVPELKGLLALKAADPGMRFPREWIPRLFRGVHLVTFTPKHGYTTTVGAFVNEGVNLREIDAVLLPTGRVREDGTAVYERVPKEMRCKERTRAVYWLHAWNNPFGGNWEGMKIAARTKSKETILWWAYGVARKSVGAIYSKFDVGVHVKPNGALPLEGTWYQVVDPCPGRNWAMGWYLVTPLGQIVTAREWPQEGDYIPGVGTCPGPWAEIGAKADGDRGPAQEPWGLGIAAYKSEMARVEKELAREQRELAEAAGRKWSGGDRIVVRDGNRIMDSRAANTPNLAHDQSVTLIEMMEDDRAGTEESLGFVSAGLDSGADSGDTSIRVGVEHVVDLLSYDAEAAVIDAETGRAVFPPGARVPRLYVLERCTNHVFAFQQWTGKDGGKGACKDFADLPRYLAIAKPEDTTGVQWVSYG